MSTGETPGPGTRDAKMCRWDLRPSTQNVGPRTPKYSNRTQDPGPPKWDPGLETPKYLSGTRDFQFSIVLIVYCTINTFAPFWALRNYAPSHSHPLSPTSNHSHLLPVTLTHSRPLPPIFQEKQPTPTHFSTKVTHSHSFFDKNVPLLATSDGKRPTPTRFQQK